MTAGGMVRQLAADGVRVVGRLVDASDQTAAISTNANQILDGADQAYEDFMSAARDLAITGIEEDLAEEQTVEPEPIPAPIDEVDSLDLGREKIAVIIWATGYTYDYGWVQAAAFDERGRPSHQRGLTQVPGLCFLGLHWMHTFKSGLLAGVGQDAEYLADQLGRTD